jgi:hypothetical protein
MKSEGVSSAFKVMMMAGGLLAVACPWAAGNAPRPATVLTYSETWNDKVACTGNNADGFTCNEYSGGRFTITATITSNDFGAAIDPGQFDGDTTFDIALGGYSYSDTLGDAVGYVAGAKKAKFELSGDVCTANDNDNNLPCPTKVYETITLTMTAKEITISISGETGADVNGNEFEQGSIDASGFDGDDSGPVTDTISFEADLDVLSASSSVVPVAGEVTTKDVTDKSGDDDTLSNVSVKGTLLSTELGQ